MEQHNVAPGSTTPVVYHVLQDANWNVAALTNSPPVTDTTSSPTVVQQYHFDPQGALAAVESGAGTALPTPYDFMQFLTFHLFHGMTWDPILQLYCTPSGRCYDPVTGRWYQRDPNETALILSNLMAHNAQTQRMMTTLTTRGQYADGLNPYFPMGGNPITRTDPTGLSIHDFDYFQAGDSIIAQHAADRAVQFARIDSFVDSGINTALSVATTAFSFLPGGDAVILAGKLRLGHKITAEDVLYAGLSVGGVAIVGKFIGKLAFAQKATRVARVARSAGNVPESLRGGAKDKVVYLGYRNNKPVYVGVTNDIARRQREHGTRFEIKEMSPERLTRDQAFAIETAIIEQNPHYENQRRSISPNNPIYEEAMEWAASWLDEHGF